jgi:hypothetical protein
MLVRRGALARAVVLVGAAIPCSTFALKMREDAAKDPAEAARRRDDDDDGARGAREARSR